MDEAIAEAYTSPAAAGLALTNARYIDWRKVAKADDLEEGRIRRIPALSSILKRRGCWNGAIEEALKWAASSSGGGGGGGGGVARWIVSMRTTAKIENTTLMMIIAIAMRTIAKIENTM